MNDSTSAPNPLRALNMPTVANFIRAIVARPMLPTKPSDIMLPVKSVPFISAMFIAAVLIQPIQFSPLTHIIPFPTSIINGVSCATGIAIL